MHYHHGMYCSSLTLQLHRQQKKSNADFMESMIAVNEEGQEFTLQQLADVSVSNPRIRRLELITRCKGFEIVAKEFDHTALFITLTTPSKFHKMTKITHQSKVVKVIPNAKFEGYSPRDAQNFLQSQWAKINAKLSRNQIKPYGFRVAEPHHDGTPHWHFLLFVDKEQTDQLISIFQEYALKFSPNEKGAKQHRCKVEHIKSGINPKTGKEYSATGYIIKYICKNIDGHGVDNNDVAVSESDWNNQESSTLAERIEAWARTYRIRQFQQIGGPSVTVWRELRRLSEQEGQLEIIRQAADQGDWAEFVKAMGGANLKRKDYAVSPAYAKSQKIDYQTGEITPTTHTRYGDEAKDKIVGILLAGVVVLSRTHIWQIKDNPRLQSARQQVMNGIVNILDEIKSQNDELVPDILLSMQDAKRPALDLCQ